MPRSVQTSSMKLGIGPESFGGAEAADSGGLALHERNISGSVELFRTAGSSIATCQCTEPREGVRSVKARRWCVCAEDFLALPTDGGSGGCAHRAGHSARTLLDCASSRRSVAE